MTTIKQLHLTRDGYRYCWSEDDPTLCLPYKSYLSKDESLKRLSFTRKKVVHPYVKLSENDRAPQLKLSGDFSVTGDKGYSMIRATHGANRGRFYYEVTIDEMKRDNKGADNQMSAARIGWGQKYSNLQAPLGYDRYGYSYRSRFGTKFHQAKGKTYDEGGGFGEGDVIGCMIELPYGNDKCLTEGRHLPASLKKTGTIIYFKKKENNEKPKVMEEQDNPPKRLRVLQGSGISFYKNGKFLGTAFRDLNRGFYYPSISLYKDCKVTVNFGPEFRHPPPQCDAGDTDSNSRLPWRPANEMAQIEMIDNLLSDMLYMIEQECHPEGDKIIEQMNQHTNNRPT